MRFGLKEALDNKIRIKCQIKVWFMAQDDKTKVTTSVEMTLLGASNAKCHQENKSHEKILKQRLEDEFYNI